MDAWRLRKISDNLKYNSKLSDREKLILYFLSIMDKKNNYVLTIESWKSLFDSLLIRKSSGHKELKKLVKKNLFIIDFKNLIVTLPPIKKTKKVYYE